MDENQVGMQPKAVSHLCLDCGCVKLAEDFKGGLTATWAQLPSGALSPVYFKPKTVTKEKSS